MTGWTDVSAEEEWKDVDEWEDVSVEKDEGALKAFFRGAREVVQGVGHTAGIVEDEDYKRTFEAAKVAGEQHPLATGAGKITGIVAPAVGAAVLAPAVPLAAPLLAAGAVGATIGGSEYARLGPAGENVDQASRLRSADLASDIGMAGIAAPAAVGKTLATRIGSGIGTNVALGAGERAVQKDIALKDYPNLTPDPFDPTAMALDAGFGALAGGAVHIGARGEVKPRTPVEREQPGVIDESQRVDQGQAEIVAQRKQEFEKQVEYSEYKIKELERSLKDPANAQRSPELAEQYKTSVIEQIENHQKEIQKLKQSIENANALLRDGMPAVMKSNRQEIPSSLPPRPEGDAFVRPEETPVPTEQATEGLVLKDSNAAMFDQEIPQESPRIDIEGLKEELGIEPSTKLEEGPVEEITISPMADNRPIAELDLDTVNDRLLYTDKYNEPDVYKELLSRRNELDWIPVRPKGLIITGGSDMIGSIVKDWVKKLGLDKEDIDFNIGINEGVLKSTELGNATVRPDGVAEANIVSAESIFKSIGHWSIEDNPRFRAELYGMSTAERASLKEALTAAHELGHILFGKLLQNDLFINGKKGVLNTLAGNLGLKKLLDDFAVWQEKTRLEDQRKAGNLFATPSKADYFRDFPEFFAQRVARELVLGKTSTSGPIAKFVNTIRSFIKDAIKHLGLSKAFERNVVDTFIIDLIKANKESVATLGKNLFEINATSTSLYDAWMWHARNLYATPKVGGTVGAGPSMSNASLHIRDAGEVIKEQAAVPDIAPLGNGTLFKHMRGLMNQGLNAFTRNGFGFSYVAQIYSTSPAIRHTSEVIHASLARQTQRSMELLAGVTDRAAWDAKRKKFFISLQKIKNNASLSIVAEKSSNADWYAVHQVFEQGIGKYSYEESLAKFGESLTAQQRTLFDTLSKLYANMYKMTEGLEGELGKKKIIPNMKGWYHAVRKGEFAVSFHIPGLEGVGGRLPTGEAIMTDLVHHQQFFSREEAQAFIDHFEKQTPEFRGSMKHNGIEEMGKTDMPDNMSDFVRGIEAAKEQMSLMGGSKEYRIEAERRLKRLLDQYVVRGGTLGSHHKLRTNVTGSAGSEMFADVGSAGKAFRDASFSSVEEYTRLMMKMEIGQKLDLLLNDEGLRGSHPETMTVVEQMRNYALNDIKTPFEMKGLKRYIDKWFTDSYTDKSYVRKFLGADKYRDAHLTDVTLGKMSHVFYLHVLMSRPGFWAAQGSQFMWIARSLVKDGAGPVDAMTAAGKGFMSVINQPKDFVDGVFYTSQNTHVFSPQFINDLNKFHVLDFLKEGSKTKLIVDLALGEKQSTAADTFSRLMSYAMMHEHYKARGLAGEELYIAAGKATDQNMVQYGRQYKAPIFQKMGVVGDLLSPLQTFSQAALGNLVADIGQIIKTPMGKGKLKASMPFMMTMAITGLMAGGIGTPLVMEYEALRLALNYIAEKMGLESKLPSVLDLVLSGDNDFSHRVLSHGLISSSTMAINEEGFDIGASNRWQPIISGVITGEKTFFEAMPTINFVLQQAGYMTDLAMHIGGVKEMNEAERRTATLAITPGMYKGLTNLKYDDEKVVSTQKGDAFVEKSGAEKASKFLGTSTINASTARLRERRFKEEDMRKQEKVDKKYELLADALMRGDEATKEKLALDLASKYQQRPEQIKARMKAEYDRRTREAESRRFMGKSGHMSTKQKLDYQRWMETYDDDPFMEEGSN